MSISPSNHQLNICVYRFTHPTQRCSLPSHSFLSQLYHLQEQYRDLNRQPHPESCRVSGDASITRECAIAKSVSCYIGAAPGAAVSVYKYQHAEGSLM